MKFKNIEHRNLLRIFCFSALLALILIIQATSNAALISLEENSATPVDSAGMTSSVLVSKETKPLDVNFVIRQESDKVRGVLISYEDTEFNGTFVLRQQKSNDGKALIYKPEALDIRILKIINDENIRSIEDYAAWLKKNFKYKKDEGKDIWATPDETLDLRSGDCEDFAFLNEAVLRIFGYKPQVLGLGGGLTPVNHAICVFKKESHYLWFDNTTLKTTTAYSFEEFGKFVIKNHGYAYIFEINKNKEKVLSNGFK